LHARGGVGEVHVAEDAELGRTVALKRVRNDRQAEGGSLHRFLREAEITARLEHPGIVPVYGLVPDEDGHPCYAMRFVEGETLKDAIDRFHRGEPNSPAERRLAFRQLLDHFRSACQAVAYAHSRGVIHRDLKPSNILLGKFGETLVVDWGLAKVTGRTEATKAEGESTLATHTAALVEATQQGEAVGTPQYMSPEQAAGMWNLVGPASDVYSLGATLYHMLTGRPPVEDPVLEVMLFRAQQGRFPGPRQVNQDLPRALEAICLKAMDREPERRYASALELASDVEHWLADEPASAWPEPWALRARRWLGRHRTLVVGTVAAVVVAALSLAVATWRLKVARDGEHHAREVAQQREQEAGEQRDKAQAHFRLARAAVDEMLTEVGQERLKNIREMEPVRRALLEKALAFYQQFLRDQGDDPGVRREAGRAFQRVGYINSLLGRHAEAVQAYQQALALHGRLAGEFPDAPEYRDDLAISQHDLARLYHETGKLDEAEAAYGEARDLYEHLAGTYPGQSDYRSNWALTYQNLGWLYSESAKIQQAEGAYRQALRLLETLTHEHPGVQKYQRQVASVQSSLGSLYKQLGRTEEAEAAFHRALPLQERLVADNPTVVGYRKDLAETQHQLGKLFEDIGRPEPAEKAYRQALALREQLVQSHPDVPDYQHGLARTHYALAWLYQRTSRLPLAEDTLRAALVIQDKLVRDHRDVPKYRSELAWTYNDLGIVYGKLGRLADAEAAYQKALELRRELAGTQPTVPEYQDAVAASYNNLANLYSYSGRTDQAEKAYLKALQAHQELAEAYRGVPKYQDVLGGAHYNLGFFYGNANRQAQAEAHYRSAIDLGESLTRDYPTVSEYRFHLAERYNMLAGLYRSTSRTGEAEALRGKALALLEQLAREQPNVTEYTVELGGNYCNMGQLVQRTQGSRAAMDWYTRAVQTLEAVLQRDPRNAVAVRYLTTTLSGQGYAYKLLGWRDQAEETFRRLVRMNEQAAHLRPGDLMQAVHLGGSYCNFGNRLRENNKASEALETYTQAVELLEAALKKDAKNGVAQQYLCVTLHMRGMLFSQLGRHTEALRDLDRAMRIGTGSDRALARAKRSTALARQSHHGEALREAEGAVEEGKPTDDILYVASVTYALAAAGVRQDTTRPPAERDRLTEQYSARAVDLLRQGIFKGYRDAAQIRTDPDLDPLRQRDDFQKLLAELETKK
jgi:serine/threonine-protein kinase